MWPLTAITHNIITISFRPYSMSIGWITSSKGPIDYYELQAYERTLFEDFECHKAIVYNPTRITATIKTFLARHNITHAWSAMSFSGESVVESIVHLPQAHPEPAHFRSPALKKMLWDYRYLYPSEDGLYAFYVCAISRQLVAQYQLLSLHLPLNPLIMTTERMAFLRLYKHHYGHAFRVAQLAKDMVYHNNNIEQMFSVDLLRRMVRIKNTRSLSLEEEKIMLAGAFGLFLLGKDLGGTD